MTQKIADKLNAIKVKHTTTVFGVAVTRWGADAFEVGTWGKVKPSSLAVAVCKVAAQMEADEKAYVDNVVDRDPWQW